MTMPDAAPETGAGSMQRSLLPGFGVLLSKELLEARRSKRIILFVVIMSAALLLIPLIGYARIAYSGDGFQHVIGAQSMNRMLVKNLALRNGHLDDFECNWDIDNMDLSVLPPPEQAFGGGGPGGSMMPKYNPAETAKTDGDLF